MFITACNSKTEAVVDEKLTSPVSEPQMQAGGYSNISNAQLQELLNQGVILVDIRREEEWQQTGIVKGEQDYYFFR